MPTSHTLTTLLMGTFVFSAAPAFSDTTSERGSVTFEISFDTSTNEIYSDIRDQAWQACEPTHSASSIATKMGTRRKCQQRLIRDVVDLLAAPDLIACVDRGGCEAPKTGKQRG